MTAVGPPKHPTFTPCSHKTSKADFDLIAERERDSLDDECILCIRARDVYDIHKNSTLAYLALGQLYSRASRVST